MLRYSLLCWALVGLALAQDNCIQSSPIIALPSCMDPCFTTNGCGSCPCANNLKGWCEMSSEGPASWFARWGHCVLGKCPDDGDIINLMTLYVSQCDSTVGGPINNETVPYPLNDWAPLAPQYLSQSSKTSSATSSSASPSAVTLTGVAPTTTGGSTSRTTEGEATVLNDATSTTLRATGAASPATATQEDSKPALSVAAIISIAVGGAVLLALIVGLVAWILRRRRRNGFPRAVSPPSYQTADIKEGYDKPELDGQVMGYQYFKADAAAPVHPPVVYAELESSSRSSPVREFPVRS